MNEPINTDNKTKNKNKLAHNKCIQIIIHALIVIILCATILRINKVIMIRDFKDTVKIFGADSSYIDNFINSNSCDSFTGYYSSRESYKLLHQYQIDTAACRRYAIRSIMMLACFIEESSGIASHDHFNKKYNRALLDTAFLTAEFLSTTNNDTMNKMFDMNLSNEECEKIRKTTRFLCKQYISYRK